mgnify:CR=1 FL=1
MSCPVELMSCDKCNEHWRTDSCFTPSRYYQLPDNELIYMETCFGWCNDCQQVTENENIQVGTMATRRYTRHLKRLKMILHGMTAEILVPSHERNRTQPNSTRKKYLPLITIISPEYNRSRLGRAIQDVKGRIKQVEDILKLLEFRTGHAKCLDCSSEDIYRLRFQTFFYRDVIRSIKHPNCGGRLVSDRATTGSWEAMQHFNSMEVIHTAEGTILASEESA